MAKPLSDLEAEALSLSPEDRAQLAQLLLASLDRDPEIEAAWNEEIHKRIEDLDRGRAPTIPLEEALAEVRRIVDG